MPSDIARDLELLILSRHSILLTETFEYDQVDSVLRAVAAKLAIPYFTWIIDKGLCKDSTASVSYGTIHPEHALNHIQSARLPAIYHFHGMAGITETAMAYKLRTAGALFEGMTGAIVVSGAGAEIHPSLQGYALFVQWPKPEASDFRKIYDDFIREIPTSSPKKVLLTETQIDTFLKTLKGFTLPEVRRVLSKCLMEDGVLDSGDISRVLEMKREKVEREGLLEFYPASERMEDISGLRGVKEWLAKRKKILREPEKARQYGLDFPKGVLMVGVQGCGKSLCAKAVASEWELPLVKMDPSRLFDKYVGESEKNFSRALKLAEHLAPVVLWIDEIEKIFFQESGESDGGSGLRVLGLFLSWLQDRKGDVFVVASANDIAKLPPELIRKGRFDEIFFVDLPSEAVRQAIFCTHLKKRKQDPALFDGKALAAAADGFSGAEIEQAVVSALYTAFMGDHKLSQEMLVDEIKKTRPLSVTMAEKVHRLREWSKGRTVPAD